MRAIFFGTYDAQAHPRVAVLRDGLRAHGLDVVECNAPLGLSTAERVALLRQPWRLPLLAARILRCWAVLAVRGRRLPRPDVVVVGYLGHFDVRLARWLWRRTPVVLDHLVGASDTARDRGVRRGLRQRLLRRLDDGALRAADVVVVDTDEHRAVLDPAVAARAVVVPVGAPEEWFRAARPGPAPADRPVRAVFFGLYTPLQGTETIGRALAGLGDADLEVTMVGSGQDLQRCRELAGDNPGVTWLDWVEPGELPALVADHDICLGIFGTGPKALRVVPNKVFQGAAAGCALVTSDTPPQRRTLGAAARLVPPGDPAALAAALRALSTDRAELDRLRAAAGELARTRFTPERATEPLVRRLRDVLAAGRHGDDVAPERPRPVTGPLPDLPPDAAAAHQSPQEASVSTERELPALSPNAWLRWDLVSRLLPAAPPGGLDVLEVGCGQGGFGARLARRYRYVGVEPDPSSCAVARARLAAAGGTGEVRQGDLGALGPDERFDVVCAFEVIEHIDEDEQALRAWADRLRPGGLLLLSTPAYQDRFGAADEMVGHFRRYDPPVLRDRLRSAGLVDVEVVHFGAPLGYLLEAGRNAVGRRRRARLTDTSMTERSHGSGRLLQPTRPGAAVLARVGTLPFRRLQRAFPQRGPGLVARARKPTAP